MRYPYTQYSFFFDTITKSIDTVLQRLFTTTGFPLQDKQLAYVPDEKTVEFVYLEKKKAFIEKHRDSMNKFGANTSKYEADFLKDLEEFMNEFADFNFVDFGMQLETKGHFLKKILKQNGLAVKLGQVQGLKKEKGALLDELLVQADEKGFRADYVEALFKFAGNLSAWESKARHTWTRLHRVARPLIEEIGTRASQKKIIKSKEEIFQKDIKEIISIAEALNKN